MTPKARFTLILCAIFIFANVAFAIDPAEKAATEFLEAIRSQDPAVIKNFIQTRLAPSFLQMASEEEHLAQMTRMGENLKDAQIAEVRVHGNSAELVLETKESNFVLQVEVEPDEPHRIAGIGMHKGAAAAPIPAFSSLEEADSYLREQASKNQFSGVVLVARKHQPEFVRAYGMAGREKNFPNQSDTSFNVGSITKAFTGVAILQLVENGKLKLEDPMSKYLKDFPKSTADKITILQLLKMQSGYGDFFQSPEFEKRKSRLKTLNDYLDFIKDMSLEFEPGTSTRYSNAGYVILGGIIERASGQSYYDYIRKEVFARAGMKQSDFFGPDQTSEKVATGYAQGRPNTEFLAPRGTSAGGSYSSARDLLVFYDALLSDRLLKPEDTALFLNHFESKPDRPKRFGIAGGAPGISAVTLMNFESGNHIIVLANTEEGIAQKIGQAIGRVLGETWGE